MESRRRKIADFQLRDRLLRLAFAGVRKSIASLSHQRHAEFEGQFSQMKKGLQCGWRSLSLYRAKKGREHGHAYRAGLLWKFRRELHAFNRLREHVHTRRAKRSMVQEARAAFALSEQRAACAEFIRIAYADSAETDRQQRLASWAAKRWKRFTARRRDARQQYSSTMSPYSRQCVQSGRDAAQLGRESGLASTVLAPTLTRTPASMVFHRPHSSDLHVLSRAKPRTLTAGLVSVPPLHADCALDYRCAPASTRSTEAAAASRPYAYLALSTPLSRPLPTSRGLQPPPMCSPPAAPGLTSARSSGGEAHVGSSAHEQKSAHCSTKTNEPTPPLSCALPAVSEELVSAAEALLEGGTTSQATLQALTEFFAMKKAAMCRQAQHRHFAD